MSRGPDYLARAEEMEARALAATDPKVAEELWLLAAEWRLLADRTLSRRASSALEARPERD